MAKGRPKGWKPAENGANPGGRPLKWTEEKANELAEKLEAWSQQDDSRFLESFCKEFHTYPQKLSELAKISEKFNEALKTAKAACAANMANITMMGACPPAFGIFALKQHGWTDKQEIAHSGEVATTHRYELPTKRTIA